MGWDELDGMGYKSMSDSWWDLWCGSWWQVRWVMSGWDLPQIPAGRGFPRRPRRPRKRGFIRLQASTISALGSKEDQLDGLPSPSRPWTFPNSTKTRTQTRPERSFNEAGAE